MELSRTRECIALVADAAYPVELDSVLARQGFLGGSCCTWTTAEHDTFRVTVSDGTFGGFLLWGSAEDSDRLSAYTENQVVHRFGTMCLGSWLISTVAYERHTLRSRLSGPLVAHTYRVGGRLKISNRGLWYPADAEDEWAVVPHALGTENPFLVGATVQAPNATNNYHLMIQTFL